MKNILNLIVRVSCIILACVVFTSGLGLLWFILALVAALAAIYLLLGDVKKLATKPFAIAKAKAALAEAREELEDARDELALAPGDAAKQAAVTAAQTAVTNAKAALRAAKAS